MPPADGLIGQSLSIANLRRLIARVAPTNATVLILGERGTGKELVARAIQQASRRRDKPFVIVNCAALPTDLLAGELFGHERGAFTGAVQRSAGLLAAADGGTVLFDEIGDLSPQGQAMLLRFLQEREIRSLGKTTTSRVDVRVIAATNADLAEAVSRKTFRADFYDRLAEVVVKVPPLRERAVDIPELVRHFVAVHARRHGRPVRGLTPEALAVVARSAWPGNVRELEQLVSRAVIFAVGRWIEPGDLDLPSSAASDVVRAPNAGMQRLSPRQRQIEALARASGSVRRGEIVSRLGISRETARRELAALVRLGMLRRHGSHRCCRYTPFCTM
jgi:two-component system NtrC family response regulator